MPWVEQHMELVADLATVLDFGRTLAEGPPDAVLRGRGSRVAAAYVGPLSCPSR